MQLYSYTMQFANRLPFSQHLVPRYSESPAVPQISQFGRTAIFLRPPKLCTKFPPLVIIIIIINIIAIQHNIGLHRTEWSLQRNYWYN